MEVVMFDSATFLITRGLDEILDQLRRNSSIVSISFAAENK
jgi:hypothetical protein